MLKRFIRYYRPHKTIFLLDMLASLLVALVGIVYPIITREMLNELIPNKQYRMIVFAGVGLLILYLVRMALNFYIQYYGHVMGVRMQAEMRSDMFRHLEKLPYSFYDNHETGKIMSRMTNDLMDVSELAHHGPENLLISSISVIISFIYLCTINVWLTLIIFACVPFLLLIAATLRKRMRDAFMESRVSTAQINASLESSISGIRVTKAFTNSDKEEEKFQEGNGMFVTARRKAYKAMGQFHSMTSFITDIFNVIILIAGGFFLYDGQITFGDYSAFVVSVSLFISPVMTLINFMEQYQTGVTGFERFVEIMDEAPEEDTPGAVDIGEVQGDIELRNVTYGYENGVAVLDNLSLSVKKGQTYALVGPSGGGKTTICHLIPHFYNCEQGEILIDGKELHTVTMSSVRRNIGIVQQDIYLFNASIRDNILYGRLDATEEEVIEAAKRANIHDYIMSLEDGYNTVIGESGGSLSQGQKQLLCISRVMLALPEMLILDEATSSIDTRTEIRIQKAFATMMDGRTSFVVAHRLSTIKESDVILVMKDGNVVESGNHEELLAKKGFYFELYNSQFAGIDNE